MYSIHAERIFGKVAHFPGPCNFSICPLQSTKKTILYSNLRTGTTAGNEDGWVGVGDKLIIEKNIKIINLAAGFSAGGESLEVEISLAQWKVLVISLPHLLSMLCFS